MDFAALLKVKLLYLGYRAYCFLLRPVALGVRTMMIQDGKVWLVRQTYMSGWFMPGGGTQRGETLEQAARREAREETGAELGELRLLGAYTSFEGWKTDHNVVFLCREFEFKSKPDAEIAELRAFDLNDLPSGLEAGHRKRLEEYRVGKVVPFGEW